MTHAPVYVLRHGQTEWNVAGRLQGHGDSPLTRHGRVQARHMGVALAACLESGVVDLVTSPLGRALQTAEIVMCALQHLTVEWRTDERLREIGVGEWQGRTQEDVTGHERPDLAGRESDWFLEAPGSESLAAFAARVGSFLADQPLRRPLVLVCHGQTGMMLRGLHCGLTPSEALRLDQPQNAFYRLAGRREDRIDARPRTEAITNDAHS